MMIVIQPTYGRNPTARPMMWCRCSHNWLWAYSSRSSPVLLSPFVRTSTSPVSRLSWTLITLWTIGISRPSTLKTTISPARIGAFPRWRKRISPLLNPGSILPDSTTTTGDSLPVKHISPFHIIKADVTIIPRLMACSATCLKFVPLIAATASP